MNLNLCIPKLGKALTLFFVISKIIYKDFSASLQETQNDRLPPPSVLHKTFSRSRWIEAKRTGLYWLRGIQFRNKPENGWLCEKSYISWRA